METEELLPAEEAWEYLGISRATLWNLIRRFDLPRYKLPLRGKRIFFKRSDLDRLRKPIKVGGERWQSAGAQIEAPKLPSHGG